MCSQGCDTLKLYFLIFKLNELETFNWFSQSQELREYIANYREASRRLKNSRLSDAIEATNEDELRNYLEKKVAEKKKAKLARQSKTNTKKECVKFVRSFWESTRHKKPLIKPAQLLERLKALKDELENEKKETKVNEVIAKSGLSKEDLLKYLQSLN